MTAPNGRTNGFAIDNPSELMAQTIVRRAMIRPSTGPNFSPDQIKQLIAELEVPFDPAVIEWRVTNTTKSGKLRGQVIPYADPRAYKVFVTCELTIFGLGSHSAAGEEWTDNDNAGTTAEAQAFKR